MGGVLGKLSHQGRTLPAEIGSGAATFNQHGPLGEPAGNHYHVFLSHAGEQKRGFVDFLQQRLKACYPGVKVFLDEASLQPGGKAMKKIPEALADAFVVVVVLSKEFISKKYPMQELQLLLERDEKGTKARLLPVFHGISYADVSKQADLYQAAADEKHQQWAKDLKALLVITGNRPDQVANSRDTLLVPKVADATAKLLFGMGKLCTGKAQQFLHDVVPRPREVGKIIELLTDEGSRRMVLLHGMAGSGKSTLAKVVFNELHGREPTVPCCFVDLRNRRVDDMSAEMQQIVRDLAFSDVEAVDTAGEKLRKGRDMLSCGSLQHTKVLLVVDNVLGDQLQLLLPTKGSDKDNSNFMELLGEGSMVLVTSCDRTAVEPFRDGCSVLLEIGGLSNAESWQMWQNLQLPCDSQEKVDRIFAHCGGLPLAIRAFAEHLKNTSLAKHPVDRDLAQAAYKCCRSSVQGNLLSAIEINCKSMELWQDDLLDIVWLFKERPWEVVERYCKQGALHKLWSVALVKKCESASGSVVRVDQAVEDYCQTVLSGQYQLFEQCSPAAADELEASCAAVELHAPGDLNAAGLTQLSQRCQQLRAVHFDGIALSAQSLSVTSKRVRWLGADNVRTSAALPLQLSRMHPPVGSAAMVELRQLQTLEELQFPGVGGTGKSVRELCVSDCPQLQSMHLSQLTALEYLTIKGCKGLTVVGGLGSLPKLTTVDACGCNMLAVASSLAKAATTPLLAIQPCNKACQVEVAALSALVSALHSTPALRLQGCDGLQAVPCLDALSHLTRLEVVCCNQLEQLQLCPSLKQLRVEGCESLTAILAPTDANNALSYQLQQAVVQGCPQLAGLAGLHLLPALSSLLLQGCAALPQLRLGSSVKQLLVEHCQALRAIHAGSAPCALHDVRLQGCPNLTNLPDVQLLSSLARMQLLQCPALQDLQLSSSLTQLLVIGCPALEAIEAPLAAEGLAPPTYRLQQAVLQGCPALAAVPNLQLLGSLTQLEVRGCHGLQQLQLGSSLERLRVKDCAGLMEIGGVATAAAPAFPAEPTHMQQRQFQERQQQQQQQSQQENHQELQHNQEQQQQPVHDMRLRRLTVLDCPSLGQLHCLQHFSCLQQVMYHPSGDNSVEWRRVEGSGCPQYRAPAVAQEQVEAADQVQIRAAAQQRPGATSRMQFAGVAVILLGIVLSLYLYVAEVLSGLQHRDRPGGGSCLDVSAQG